MTEECFGPYCSTFSLQGVSVPSTVSVAFLTRQPDLCAFSRGKYATYLILDGSLLVLQYVSVAEDYCHGHCNTYKGFALMLLCVLVCEICDGSHDTRLFRT
jgi:hypothetical protein